MLAYFPQIYPGELLYSVVARYLRHVGSMKQTAALTALFGRRLVIASPDLPGYLQVLSQEIPSERCLDVDRLIDETTLFPYYTAFQPPAVRSLVRGAMRAGAVEDLHLRLGLPAFRAGRVTTLRFCFECFAKMQDLYGEAYWRREHQLPGAVLCVEHETILRQSTTDLLCLGRHNFVAATRATCPTRAPTAAEAMPPLTHAFLLRITRSSVALLSTPPEPRSFADWTVFYRERMHRAGLARSPRSMDQAELARAFRRHVRDGLRYLPAAVRGLETSESWLSSLVRKQRKATHPLMHVLLQDLLAARSNPEPPFGKGPWPCLNPLARHRLARTIEVVSLHRNRGRIVGVFQCRCGYTYTRNSEPASGANGPPRFQAFGPLLLPALKMWVAAGVALREIGRRLDLDPRTVVNLAVELGISTPWTWTVRPKSQNQATPLLPPATGRTDRSADPAPRAPARARRDWADIDRACVREVRQFAQAIRGDDPPVRITRAEIERRAHRRDWLSHRREKVPLATACLKQVVESVGDFQLRRIHWAIDILEHEIGSVKAWQVMRKAGLRGTELQRIQDVLDTPSRAKSAVA